MIVSKSIGVCRVRVANRLNNNASLCRNYREVNIRKQIPVVNSWLEQANNKSEQEHFTFSNNSVSFFHTYRERNDENENKKNKIWNERLSLSSSSPSKGAFYSSTKMPTAKLPSLFFSSNWLSRPTYSTQTLSSSPLACARPAFFHTSAHTQSDASMAFAVILGLGSVSAVGFAGSQAVKAYKEYQASLPSPEELAEQLKQQEEEEALLKAEQEKLEQEKAKEKAQEKKDDGKGEARENIFKRLFNIDVGTNYYDGGFEDEMTRREAALILGVRESSSPKRIKEAHRKLLVLNHPDTGGSTFIAGKINEAKELLLKNKQKE